MHGSYDKFQTKIEPVRTLRFTSRRLCHGIKLITSITDDLKPMNAICWRGFIFIWLIGFHYTISRAENIFESLASKGGGEFTKFYYLISIFAEGFCNRWHSGAEKIKTTIHLWQFRSWIRQARWTTCLFLLVRLGCKSIFDHSQNYNPAWSKRLFFLHVKCLESNLCQIFLQFNDFNIVQEV